MKELAIGEEIRIRCVEDKPAPTIRRKNHNRSVKNIRRCDKCIFVGYNNCYLMSCGADDRSDGKDVHFELVED